MKVESGELINNETAHNFELPVEDQTASIAYEKSGNVYILTHTEVPDNLGGKGVGTELVEKALHYIKTQNARVVPLCSFVHAYIERHPQWNILVAEK